MSLSDDLAKSMLLNLLDYDIGIRMWGGGEASLRADVQGGRGRGIGGFKIIHLPLSMAVA